jgi:hypothetical protein
MKRITQLRVLEGFRVWLRFDDDVEGIVDFSTRARTGVYAAWEDYDFFRRARIGDAGELVWNEQLDFCPDTLWLRVTGRTPENLASNLVSATVHA